MRESLLQDFVVPLCSAKVSQGSAHLDRLLGTAFFINGEGVFLAARHVMEAIAAASPPGLVYGLITKSQDARARSVFAFLRDWDGAPTPYDIAVGKVDASSRSWFSRPEGGTCDAPWQDVATLGYPETALNTSAGNFNVHARMLKGYIQRRVAPGEISLIAPHPVCYELSFPVTLGMSGAPLFAAEGDKQELVGVCVGSYSAEVTEYRTTLVEEDGHRLEEHGLKVEQIGIAQSLEPLLGWTPNVSGGRSLSALIEPSAPAVQEDGLA